MAPKDTEETKTEVQDEEVTLDMSQTAVKKMIAEARERGYITYDQLNAVLPPDQVSSDQIEDVMSMLSEMGIQVTEDDEEADEDDASKGATDKTFNPLNFFPSRGIEFVTTTSLNPAPLKRSTAGPENTACVAAK